MRKLLLLSLVCFMYASTPALSQIFLKANAGTTANIPGIGPGGMIQGESNDEMYQDQIEVLAYSNGIAGCTNAGKGGGGAGACKTSLSSLTFMMTINRSVIPLKHLTLTGRTLPFVELSFVKPGTDGGTEYYKIRMEDVIISSMQESGSGSEKPTFSVELDSKKIAWGYRMQTRNGSMGNYVTTGWDAAANKTWNYTFSSSSPTY